MFSLNHNCIKTNKDLKIVKYMHSKNLHTSWAFLTILRKVYTMLNRLYCVISNYPPFIGSMFFQTFFRSRMNVISSLFLSKICYFQFIFLKISDFADICFKDHGKNNRIERFLDKNSFISFIVPLEVHLKLRHTPPLL